MRSTDSKVQIPSLREMLDEIDKTTHQEYLDQFRAAVEQPAQFDRMRDHIHSLYNDVTSSYSFVDANGQIFDCIPWNQQPSVRGTGMELGALQEAAVEPGPPSSHTGDALDKTLGIPPGTVATRRVTLAELASFETLEESFRKVKDVKCHKHAVASMNVKNYGARSILSVSKPWDILKCWHPPVGAPKNFVWFSLSQIWCIGGTGENTQTVEAGWQVNPTWKKASPIYPAYPILFIYWTPDHYTTGGYGPDNFVANPTYKGNYIIGGALPTKDDKMIEEIRISWWFRNDLDPKGWYLYVEGSLIGYYPSEIFNNGALANGATELQFGGEVCSEVKVGQDKYVPDVWPPMGTGWSHKQSTYLAKQKDIAYYSFSNTEKFEVPLFSYGLDSRIEDKNYILEIHNEEIYKDPKGKTYPYFYFGGPPIPKEK